MGSDFSGLDAELDALEAGPGGLGSRVEPRASTDALLLARSYAGSSLELYVVDSALNEIDADGTLLRTRSSFPPEMPRARRQSVAPASTGGSAPTPTSEEIVLPDPVEREPQRREPGSGEMPLHALQGAPRSGSFSLEQAAADTRSRAEPRAPSSSSRPDARASTASKFSRDDTLEPFDEELIEADAEMVDFTAGAPGSRPSSPRTSPSSSRPSTGPAKRESLFAPKHEVSAQEEADAAFAELFSEATRQSSMPSQRNSQAPETYNDDTETFDSSALGFIENDTKHNAETSMDEELDSAEFEIVVDGEVSKGASEPARGPSESTEKRPSFLGRLFGRKDE